MRKLAASIVLVFSTLFGSPAFADELEDARKALAQGEIEEARDDLAKVTTDSIPLLLLRAEINMRLGKLPDAQKDAEKAAKSKDAGEKIRATTLRGEILWAQGKRDDAIATLKTLETEPAARRARLFLGEYLIQVGKRADAQAPLESVVADYNQDRFPPTDYESLGYVGRAAHLLRKFKSANRAYNEAEQAGGKASVEILLWRADLFLEKYNPGDAGAVVLDAEKQAPGDPRVRVAKARVLLENAMDFAGAESEIRRALAVNPNMPEAFFVKAGLALRDLDTVAADAAADQGLAVNPSDLELLSMKAAIRFLADDRPGFEKYEAAVLKLNPEFSAFYQIVAEYAEWEHRYDDILAFMEKATKIDPEDPKAYAQLGLNLIRAGKEEEGVKALTEAADRDPYNVRVKNTLDLYANTIAKDYTTVDGQTFRIRYAKDEKDVMERYVPQMLEEAWASMVKRYGFKPTTPVSIELYETDEAFSVRTSGLPNVGIQGVCFGKSLALLSPSAGPFNWGNVLWHELGHVFAIQLSKNHVPRWFTEGLSEYETIIRRKEWQREEDPALYAALKAGRVPALTGFNRAFTHVDTTEEVVMAYYAASQIVVFMVEKYGWDKVVSMLPRWGAGERTPDVIKHSLGVDAETVDKEYRAWLDARYERYTKQYVPDLHSPNMEDAAEAAQKNPKDARKQVEYAFALLRAGKRKEGEAALQATLAIDPKEPDALYALADLALDEENVAEKDRAAKAKGYLEKLVDAGHDGYAVRMKMANIAAAVDDVDGAEAGFEAAWKLDPIQAEPLISLVRLFRSVHDERKELDALRRYTQIEQHDRDAWLRLLECLVARYKWDEAVTVGESLMFIDPENPEAHRLYARALANVGRHRSAIYEYNSALLAGAPPEMAADIYRELAFGYDKLKKPELATRARELEKKMRARAERAKEREGKEHDDPRSY
ncbi:MAG: tetratricopeptide repeat protein [Polyangiaceae bacterium]